MLILTAIYFILVLRLYFADLINFYLYLCYLFLCSRVRFNYYQLSRSLLCSRFSVLCLASVATPCRRWISSSVALILRC